MAAEAADHGGAVAEGAAVVVFDDVLNDVVAVLVLREGDNGVDKLRDDKACLCGAAALEDALDDAAAVGVCCEVCDAALKGLEDELYAFGAERLNALLDDVISVLVAYAVEDAASEFGHKGLLDGGGHLAALDDLLHNAAPVRLLREVCDAPPQSLGEPRGVFY